MRHTVGPGSGDCLLCDLCLRHSGFRSGVAIDDVLSLIENKVLCLVIVMADCYKGEIAAASLFEVNVFNRTRFGNPRIQREVAMEDEFAASPHPSWQRQGRHKEAHSGMSVPAEVLGRQNVW